MRPKTLLVRAAAVVATWALLTVGTAFAEGFVASTRPSMRVSPGTHVDVGTVVTLSGTLKTDRPFCRNDSQVTLRTYGDEGTPGGRVDTMTTSKGGHYEFSVTVDEQARFRLWFRGKVGGVHPDIKTCEKSRSRTVTIRPD